jgi:hypothetical protein
LRAGVLALALVVVCGRPSPALGQSGAGSTSQRPTQITAYDVRIRLESDGRLFVTEDITVRGLERAPEWDGLHRTFSPNPDGHTIPFSEMLGISRPP